MRVVGLVVALGACGGGDPPGDDAVDTDAAEVAGEVTYHRQIRPMFERSCGACHAPGGVAPLDLTYDPAAWADGPPTWAVSAAAAVADGTMPPWLPSDDCHPIEGSRALTDRERARVAAWAAAGFPEGDPSTYRAPRPAEVVDLGPPDLTLDLPEPYVADRTAPDDYRCFVLDAGVEDTTWVRALTVQPDAVAIVHHVLLYRLDASYAAEVAAWEAEDDTPGYRCFGAPGTWDAETVAGWAPGQAPEVYAPGTARRLDPESILVLQLHYNTLGLPVGQAAPADRTAVALWTTEERPTLELLSFPFANTELEIPAGDPDVEAVLEVDLDGYLPRAVNVRGAFPHMHTLGRSLRVDVLREDGSETCVIDVPRWDFDWQQSFFFASSDPIGVLPDESLRLTCRYDNSAASQPVVNGVQVEPRDVGWGEGTFDEMCLAYLYVTLPVRD